MYPQENLQVEVSIPSVLSRSHGSSDGETIQRQNKMDMN